MQPNPMPSLHQKTGTTFSFSDDINNVSSQFPTQLTKLNCSRKIRRKPNNNSNNNNNNNSNNNNNHNNNHISLSRDFVIGLGDVTNK